MNYLKEFLNKTDLEEIQNKISEIEKSTSGELRLCLKLKRGLLEKKNTVRDIAMKEFYKLGMHKTEDKTGILIFILFGEKKFEIVAGEGINSRISQNTWDEMTKKLIKDFSEGNYKKGLIYCIQNIGEILSREFPVKEGDRNELPDEIIIE